MSEKKQFITTLIKAVVSIAIGVIIALLPPFEGLEISSMRYMGILTSMILLMVFRVLPEYVLGFSALGACAVFGVADFKVVFGTFSQDTIWLTFLFIAFATGLAKSGLLTRVAYLVLAPFPQTFQGQVLAIMASSVVVTPLIPNPQAKLSLLGPIVGSIAKENGFEKNSKGSAGLFTAMFIPTNNLTVAFLSGTAMVLMLIGFLPENLRGGFTWISWLGFTIIWYITHLILTYVFIVKYYKPDNELTLPSGYAKSKLKELGPLTQMERTALIIMVATIFMWTTESLHGISVFTISIISFIALSSSSLLKPVDMQMKYPWPLFLTLGTLMAISSLLNTVGINNWLSPILGKVVGPYIGNVYILIIAVCLSVYLLRYAIISVLAVTIIVYAVFGPIAISMGVHPIIVLFIGYVSAAVYNLSFHNVSFIMVKATLGWDMIDHKSAIHGSYAFMVIQIIACLVSVPFWKWAGFIG